MKIVRSICNIVFLFFAFFMIVVVSFFELAFDYFKQLGNEQSKRYLKGEEWIWE